MSTGGSSGENPKKEGSEHETVIREGENDNLRKREAETVRETTRLEALQHTTTKGPDDTSLHNADITT